MFDVDVIQTEDYIRLNCRGPASLQNLKNIIDRIKGGEFGGAELEKFLIDLRPMAGTIETLQRFELGRYIAEQVPRLRIAAISKKETHSKLGENVAVNRGAHVISTYDENEAIDWLKSDP